MMIAVVKTVAVFVMNGGGSGCVGVFIEISPHQTCVSSNAFISYCLFVLLVVAMILVVWW